MERKNAWKEYTEAEMEEIKNFADFVRNRRK